MNCINCSGRLEIFLEIKSKFKKIPFCFVKCKNCGLILERDILLDPLKVKKKVANLYEGEYFHLYDSGYKARSDSRLKLIAKIIKSYSLIHPVNKILDYGGGKGYFTSRLFDILPRTYFVNYYDPYVVPTYKGGYNILKEPIASDVVVAVEVIEHFVSLNDLFSLLSLIKKNGLMIFTTHITDFIKQDGISKWWYFNPDAGHMILYSLKSLQIIARKRGFFYLFFPRSNVHVFYRSKLSKISVVKAEKYLYLWLRRIKNMIM